MSALTPFVYWAQNKSNLYIKVDLKDVKEPHIKVQENSIEFQASGKGAQGSNDYQFNLSFFRAVDSKEPKVKINDNSVNINLTKAESEWWPRLILSQQKPSWLKVDFDRWQSEDDLEEQVNDIMDDYPDVFNSLQKHELGYLKEDFRQVYLLFYNFLMWCAFTYVFVVMIMVVVKSDNSSPETNYFTQMYSNVGHIMRTIHLFQVLEVMHPMFGYVKGGALMPFMQIFGRLFILFGNLEFEPKLQSMPVTTYLFFAWTSIEVIRYLYYLIHISDPKKFTQKKYIYPLFKWLRYTAWIVLYPWGFVCEAVIIFRNMIFLHSNPRGNITLPNPNNFTFDYLIFLRIYMLFVMFPGMYTLMKHMYVARIKKLGGKEPFNRIFKWKLL